jgi:hypothetical protein
LELQVEIVSTTPPAFDLEKYVSKYTDEILPNLSYYVKEILGIL